MYVPIINHSIIKRKENQKQSKKKKRRKKKTKKKEWEEKSILVFKIQGNLQSKFSSFISSSSIVTKAKYLLIQTKRCETISSILSRFMIIWFTSFPSVGWARGNICIRERGRDERQISDPRQNWSFYIVCSCSASND